MCAGCRWLRKFLQECALRHCPSLDELRRGGRGWMYAGCRLDMAEVVTAADGGLWAAAVAAGSCGGACVRGAQRWLRSCGRRAAFAADVAVAWLARAACCSMRRWPTMGQASSRGSWRRWRSCVRARRAAMAALLRTADGAFVRSLLLQPSLAVAGRAAHTTMSDDGPSQACSGWVGAPPPRAGDARTCVRGAQRGMRCCGRRTAGGARRHGSRWLPAPPAGVCDDGGPPNGGSCGVGGRAAAGRQLRRRVPATHVRALLRTAGGGRRALPLAAWAGAAGIRAVDEVAEELVGSGACVDGQ